MRPWADFMYDLNLIFAIAFPLYLWGTSIYYGVLGVSSRFFWSFLGKGVSWRG